MKNLATKVQAFTNLVKDFRYQEALDQFYHPEIVKHENEQAPTIGLDKYKQEMVQFQAAISNPQAQVLNLLVSDEVSVVEWRYQFDHREWGPRDFREVSVQRWRDGKIVHERHYYKRA